MKDYLIKTTAFNGKVRAYALIATDMVNEAVKRQQTWPTASAALGRALMASTMMATMQKGKAKLTVKIEGKGPLGAIVVDANTNGETRGYVDHPQTHFDLNESGSLDVARAVGTNGTLSVVKDLGLKDYFTGSVPLVSGELGDDFTYYFASSEQTPSSVGVGVLVNPDHSILAAGGFIIQLMPGADDKIIQQIEDRIAHIPPISELVRKGLSPEEILYQLLGKENVIVHETMPVTFSCTCSKGRIGNAIISLGKDEIRSMIEKDEGAETRCHFCNEVYDFSIDDLEQLFSQAK